MHVYSSDDNRIAAYGLIAVLAVVLSIGANWATSGLDFIPAWLVSAPSVTASFALLYTGLDRYAWRWRILSKVAVVQLPDVEGQYSGQLRSSYEDTQLGVSMQIEQTWTRIIVRLTVDSPKSSNSSSMTAKLTSVGMNLARLTYTYRNQVSPGVAAEDMSDHDGTAEITINLENGVVEGRYYNFRQRTGTLTLRRTS